MKKNLPAILITLFTIIIIVGIVIFALSQKTPTDNQGTKLAVGQVPPNFSLKDLDDKTYSLSSFKGQKPVFMEFFAVWCPHCQAEAPVINNLYNKYKDKVQFLEVQASNYGKDYEEKQDTKPATKDDLTWYRDNFKVQFPILQDYKLNTATAYNISGFPTFYLIGKDGKISYTDVLNPNLTEDSLSKEIEKAISK